jgi:molybdopterin synthase catalytic subunit
MASQHFATNISAESVPDVEKRLEPSTAHGADIRFHGVVRDREGDRPITAIDYSCYAEMAERELEKIAEVLSEKFPTGRLFIHHRIGEVAVSEASLLIRAQMPHSAEAFVLAQEALKMVKETVPVWKKPCFVD